MDEGKSIRVIDVERFEAAILDAVATRHRKNERAETVFAVINSTGAVTRARQGELVGRMIERASLCKLAYIYADINGRTQLAFNSFNARYSEMQWFEQSVISDIRRRSMGILLKPLPLAVEAFFFAGSWGEAKPYRERAEEWLETCYAQLAAGLSQERWRRSAAEQLDLLRASRSASAVLAGLPAELQQEIQGV